MTQSSTNVVHPSVAAGKPDDLFGVDLFSPGFDNVSKLKSAPPPADH